MLLLGDAAERLKEIKSESIDMVLTSPPYDNLRAYKGYSFNFEIIAEQLFRVIKPGGIIVWVVQDGTVKGEKTGTSFKQALYFKTLGLALHDTLIYQRQGICGEFKGRFRTDHEYVFVLRKHGCPHICNKHLIKIQSKHPNKVYRGTTQREQDGTTRTLERGRSGVLIGEFKNRGTVWDYGVPNAEKGMTKDQRLIKSQHPATFPDQLANDLIICWSNPGDTVLDPFLGSGTTGVAALQLGRKFIGIEISEQYIDIAGQRLKGFVKKPVPQSKFKLKIKIKMAG